MRRWSMKWKLVLLSNAGIAGLAIFAAIAFLTVSQIQVGSDFFEQKRTSNSVAADFENPPQSLQKVYSLAVEAKDAATPGERQKIIEQIREAHKDYQSGHQHYMQVLPQGRLRDLIAGESNDATEAWYSAAEQKFFPALLAGDLAAAEQARKGPMEAAYRRDAATVDQITQLTSDWDAANDLAAKQLVHQRTVQMIAVAVLLFAGLILLGRSIVREMTRGIAQILTHLEALADCDLRESIEVGGAEEFARMLQALEKTFSTFREVMGSIRNGAGLVASASAEMDASTHESVAFARDNAARTQQAATAIAQMDAAIKEVARSAQQTAMIVQSAEFSADKGASAVAEAVAAVRGIAQATSQVEQRINSLGQHSEKIGRIVTAIEEIAEQTNLLALNAAIEAARAGENGRGFAVVAGEVRRLAERTTAATGEVGRMVTAIQQETSATIDSMHMGAQHVEGGVGKTEATGGVLDSIRGLAHESGRQASQIASAAEQQSAAISEIHSTIDGMAAFVQHISSTAEQTANACHELSQLAGDLNAHSARFRLPVNQTVR